MSEEYLYLQKTDKGYAFCDVGNADMVCVSVDEFNGMQVAVNMIHRRALQQIDKSMADEHGYTLLRADEKYNQSAKHKMWLITKTTPYSIKISPEEVKKLIELDLRRYYKYGFPKFKFECTLYNPQTKEEYKGYDYYRPTAYDIYNNTDYWKMSEEKLLEEVKYWNRETYTRRKLWIPICHEWINKRDFSFTDDLCKLSCNYAQGKYEVSYWGSKII